MKLHALLSLLLCTMVCAVTGCRSLDAVKKLPKQGDETFFVDTEDGWRLALNHYYPTTKRASSNRTPIILCHGLGYNGNFWSIDQSVNFAQYLVDNGYDVWVISLRGSGLSTKPGMSILRNFMDAEAQELRSASFAPSKQSWTIDHYIRYDIPAAIEFVRKHTGKQKITWVGHSLGGMIMLGYLGLYAPTTVQGAVTVASPIIIPQPPNDMTKAFFDHKIIFKTFMLVNTRSGATTMIPFHRFFITPDAVMLYNLDNVEPHIVGKVLEYVVEDLPIGVIDQVYQMVQFKEFISFDKSINYTQLCERITIPVLLCTGKADNIAPPESVRFAYNKIQSRDKTFKLFGRANNHAHNYGHNDLLLGTRARNEVYPVILDWLNRHTTITD